MIDTEKQSSGSLNVISVKSDESINEDSSFLKLPIEEAPKVPEVSKEDKEDAEKLKEKPAKEDSLVLAVEKDKQDKEAKNKLLEIEKLKDVSVDNLEEEMDIKEKIKINSIEILINIVTLTPSNIFF